MMHAERICLRCLRPEDEHVPGPPDPPLIRGHLGATEDRPWCCNQFDRMSELPAEVAEAAEGIAERLNPRKRAANPGRCAECPVKRSNERNTT